MIHLRRFLLDQTARRPRRVLRRRSFLYQFFHTTPHFLDLPKGASDAQTRRVYRNSFRDGA